MDRRIKLALVCTQGGHFEQMTNLSDFYEKYPHFWITNRNKQTEGYLKDEEAYFVKAAHFKTPWTYLQQIPPMARILFREKPTHIISTGSGRTAFVPYLLSPIIKSKFIFIDTFSRVNGHSKMGAFLVRTGNNIYSQWENKENRKSVYIGPVFKSEEKKGRTEKKDLIFVTVGTRTEPFGRLLGAVEELVKEGKIHEKVVVQAGHTKFQSDVVEVFDFCSPDKIEKLISEAKYVITQESAGIGTQCLKHETKIIVMPRDYNYRELPAKSDMNEDLQYRLEELGYAKVVNNKRELEEAIRKVDNLRIGFIFDNRRAITTLKEIVEGK